MEFLKKILRHALATKSSLITLGVNEEPQFFDQSRFNLPRSGLGALDQNEIDSLFAFLFPNYNQGAEQSDRLRGALNIPNVGVIQIIALGGNNAKLSMYLPSFGVDAFEEEWLSLSKKDPDDDIIDAKSKDDFKISSAGGFIPTDLQSTPQSTLAPPYKLKMPQVPEPSMTTEFIVRPTVDDELPKAHGIATRALNENTASPADSWTSNSNTPPTQAPKSQGPQKIQYDTDPREAAAKSFGQNAIDDILTDMIKNRASDLHLTGGQAICLRIDGDIGRISNSILDAQKMRELLDPIFPERNRQEFLQQNDTDFAYEISNVGRFRVNVFRDHNGVGAVLRHIPTKILTAEQLSLPPAITKLCELHKGLVLVTGPTGSGKSTTLAAMIDLINKTRHDHILTIEDPIEFIHPQQRCLVNQREVHRHTSSFARALRAALREDPDIILIGELRDLETISIAIETAETGHLVFGTLHTTTAVSTVDRIIDQFPADRQAQIRTMLSSSLRGVVSQTLVKKKQGGRAAALEVLIINDAASAMIREGKIHMLTSHMQTQKADGNQLLNEALLRLVKDGMIDGEEAYRKAVDKNGLLEALKRINRNPNAELAGQQSRGPSGQRSAS